MSVWFKRGCLSLAILGLLFTGAAQAQNGRGNGGHLDALGDRFLDVIVVLDESFAPGRGAANRAAAAAVARSHGVSLYHAYGTALFGFAAKVPPQRLDALRNDPRVAYVNFNAAVAIPRPVTAAPKRCQQDPTGPGCGTQEEDTVAPSQEIPWGIDRIGADTNPYGGFGIHVSVLDTGIDSNHPDLQDNLDLVNSHAIETCMPVGKNKKACKQDWDDNNGHGTHVAGTIGAIDNNFGVLGVASAVTLHAVKVLDSRGSGSWAGVIAGIDWVAGEAEFLGVPVVANMSLGGGGSKRGTCTAEGYSAPVSGGSSLYEAICNATGEGVVFVVAAGNDDIDAENNVPAAYDDAVITVSATGQTADLKFDGWPWWSNWGDDAAEPAWTTKDSAPVAIAAPGMGILSTWNNGNYNTISGTSMASPHVAGAIALYLARNSEPASYAAFVNVRAALLVGAEETTGVDNIDGDPNFTIKNGNPHGEDFLDVRGDDFWPPSSP